MMGRLVILVRDVKKQKPGAINEMIDLFEPKIKKSSRLAPLSSRADLEQELRLQIVKAVNHFEEPHAPDLWKMMNENNIKTS